MFPKSKPRTKVSIIFSKLIIIDLIPLSVRWSYRDGAVWEPVDCRPWCTSDLPDTPEKGTVLHSGTSSDEDHSLGQVVTYTCDDGYEFTDTESGMCKMFIICSLTNLVFSFLNKE